MHQKILNSDDASAWNRLLGKVDKKCIYYTPEFARIAESHFKGVSELFFYGDENNYVVYPYLKKRVNELPFFSDVEEVFYDISSFEYGGPALHCQDKSMEKELFSNFIDAFHSYCLKANIVTEFARLHPIFGNHMLLQEKNPQNVKEIHDIVYVDLTEPEETIWANFDKENRKAIRKAKRDGVTVEIAEDRNAVEEFRRLYTMNMDKWGARKEYHFSVDYFERLLKEMDGNATLFVSKHNGKIVVGSLLLHKFDIAYDYLRGADPDFLGYRPNNLIVYEIIKWAKKAGYKYFVMGGGYKSNDSIFRFKSLFSKKTKPFYRYSFIHNNEAYEFLCDAFRRKAQALEPDFFPLYRSPVE
ncbi:MAG TPA: GNAT family N-acetyltransferase [Candidatus Nanoarchaeia archaeon]|nr:GNAT family N-acetyltransferase [Candidatus Nanoarchaeia archaeon]